ncbi:MAG: M48 family metalloprotease, partial [Planctomycetota bacterium]
MRRRGWVLASCAVAAGLMLTAGCNVGNVDVGKIFGSGKAMVKAIRPFDWEEEKEIGGTVAVKIAGTFQVHPDTRARAYVNLIAATVASRSVRSDLVPRVLIIKEDVPNAFACPGGYMFVTTGLLRICGDESELAGILGHEFAHVAQKHTLSGLRWKRAFSVGAREAASYGKEELQRAYEGFKPAVNKAINGVVNNRHGTKAESEADTLGAEWAALAGYDAAGLGRLIGR